MYIIPLYRKNCHFFRHILYLLLFIYLCFFVLFMGFFTVFSLTENIEFVTFKIASKNEGDFL